MTIEPARPDCRTCQGSGHGERLDVDNFSWCATCHGTGVARCDFCPRAATCEAEGYAECDDCHARHEAPPPETPAEEVADPGYGFGPPRAG